MADRRVTHAAKSSEGNITGLGNPGAAWYSRTAAQAILDIERGVHTYHVGSGDSRSEIHVIKGRHGRYLRTVANEEQADNLDELPDLELRPEPVGCAMAMRQLLGA